MAYTTYPLIVATTGAAHTKGSYVQIVASTPYASSRIHLMLISTNVSEKFILMDLATGGAGVESVVVANLTMSSDLDAIVGSAVAIDVDIPSGTRLAFRAQSATAATTIGVTFVLEDRALGSLATPVTYGADTVNSRGTSVDPGTTINTKGSYVALTASTSARIDALVICVTTDIQGSLVTSFETWNVDIATGGAGVETVVIPDLGLVANANNDKVCPGLIRLPVSIPASTRVAVRAACSSNAAQRLLRVTLIGMQEPASSGGATSVAYVG